MAVGVCRGEATDLQTDRSQREGGGGTDDTEALKPHSFPPVTFSL